MWCHFSDTGWNTHIRLYFMHGIKIIEFFFQLFLLCIITEIIIIIIIIDVTRMILF